MRVLLTADSLRLPLTVSLVQSKHILCAFKRKRKCGVRVWRCALLSVERLLNFQRANAKAASAAMFSSIINFGFYQRVSNPHPDHISISPIHTHTHTQAHTHTHTHSWHLGNRLMLGKRAK